MIGLIISVAMATYSVSKYAVDKKKEREKYFLDAQNNLIKKSAEALSGNQEERRKGLKAIATQYASNVIQQKTIEQQANEIADKKMERDQFLALGFGVLSIGVFTYTILKNK
jgi:hypothetical protein